MTADTPELPELRAIFETALIGIALIRDRRIVRCNRHFEELFGYGPGELIGQTTRFWYVSDAEYLSTGALAYTDLAHGNEHQREQVLLRKDGSTFMGRLSGSILDPAHPAAGSVWLIDDVTSQRDAEAALRHARDELERRVLERTRELTATNARLQDEIFERIEAEQRIWHMAHHDSLTGLPNRTLLHDRLDQALAQAQRGSHRVAVMFLDLDRFKSINDTLGHAVGDELLRHVAEKLRGAVRSVDTVSRLGGDEFIVVLNEIGSRDDAVRVAGKIIDALAPPVRILGHELAATPSIGISVFPDDGAGAMPLMKNADTAMYHAKAAGRNTFRFFAPDMNCCVD